VAFPRLATPQKRARSQRATIVFIDECGLLLSPLVRRTLAPRGQTPKLLVRGRHREKVSVIAGLSLSPKRNRLGLYFRTIPNGSFNGASVAAFLRQLLRHIRGKVIVVWDRWSGHRGPDVRSVLADHKRLRLEQLPAYAPVLNPVEHLWSHLKWSKLCNFAPKDATDLDKKIAPALKETMLDQSLLLGFWRGAKLGLSRWHC
jgi:transposase